MEQIMMEELGETPLPCVIKKRLKVKAAGVRGPEVSGEMGGPPLACVRRKGSKVKVRNNEESDVD